MLSASDRAVGTILMKSGANGSIRAYTVQVLGRVEVVVADDHRRACLPQFSSYCLAVSRPIPARYPPVEILPPPPSAKFPAPPSSNRQNGRRCPCSGRSQWRSPRRCRPEIASTRQRSRRLGQVIQTKFEKGGLFQDFRSLFEHLIGGRSGNGNTNLADARTKEVRGDLIVLFMLQSRYGTRRTRTNARLKVIFS